MKSKYVFYGMVLLLIVFLAAIVGGAYASSRILTQRSHKLLDLKLQQRALDEQQVALGKAKKDPVEYEPLKQIAKTAVPQDKDQAQAVREIVKIAEDTKVKLASISFPASTLGGSAAGGTSAGNSNLTQLKQVKGIPGVYSLDITIQQDTANPVSYDQFTKFLEALERNRRTAQINNISLQPTPKDRSTLTFNLTLQEYIKP